MPSRNLTEIVLTRVVGRDRAEAIVGDLLELASSRGRLWYYVASLGTVLSFTWRLPAAFLIACFSFLTVQYLSSLMLTVPLWHALGKHLYITETLGRAVRDLSFVVPFAVVKYGVKDRLSKVSIASFVVTGLVYFCFNKPLLVLALVALGLLAIVGSLASSNWRRTFLILAFTSTVGVLVDFNLGNFAHLGCWIYAHKPLNETSHYHYFELGYAFPRTVFWIVTWTMSILDTLVLCFVCSSLHRYFLPPSNDIELALYAKKERW